MKFYEQATCRKRLIVLWAPALMFVTALSCGGGRRAAGDDFTLLADSLGETPMHADALKVDNLAKAHDGSMATRWTSVGDMEPGFFLEITFPKKRNVAGLVLNTAPSPDDFPRRFVVEASADGTEWEEVAAGGPTATLDGVTTITFERPRRVLKILITLKKAAPYWWSIYELEVKYAS